MFARYPLDRPYTPNGGNAFVAPIPAALDELRRRSPETWRLLVAESEKLLGPSDAQHQRIRDFGSGAFSVWQDTVYFSASDNSDCNTNDRKYELLAFDLGPDSALYQDMVERVVSDDAELLRLIVKSSNVNNNFFRNFFEYYNNLAEFLTRNHIPFPQSVLELGSGEKPYVGLRCLLEGVTRFIANDLGPINGNYPKLLGTSLRQFLEMVHPGFHLRLDELLSDSSARFGVKGLEVWDRVAFEDIPIPDGELDLITSVSVLEHVMKPAAVVKRMAELLKGGAVIFHSVDLRDHQSFWAPLTFLTMTPSEYEQINTENRLRLSDWLMLFEENGFELLDARYAALAANEISRGVPIANASTLNYETYDAIVPWVTDEMRARFSPPYDSKELRDLSVVSYQALLRKKR